MRGLLTAMLIAATFAGPIPRAFTAEPVVELDVAFEVWNVNRSLVPCPTDLGHYTIRGTLLAPQGLLSLPADERSVTLLVHGGTAGEWVFHYPAAGIDFAHGLARLGHAVVTIDRLGYDRSRTEDGPNGYLTCIGGEADISRQIIGFLRNGFYTAGGAPGPRFDKRVVLAGHSQGGAITMVEAYSFGSADAYVPMGWSRGFRSDKLMAIGAHTIPQCAAGGSAAEYDGTGPSGYADEWATPEQQVEDVYWTPQPPEVVELIGRLRNRDGCGFISSLGEEAVLDAAYSMLVKKPILLVYGANDELLEPSSFAPQRDGYVNAPKGRADLVLIENAGHLFYLETPQKAEESQSAVAAWLASEAGA